MLPFLRPKKEKDIGDKLLGKRKKYRLPRNGSAVAVTGTLLAYYRREVLPDGLMPPSGGRVELLALFRTQAGRFFLYYVVTYPETEDIAGRQEYAHVCQDFASVRDFLGSMAYPNRAKFVGAVLATAQKTMAPQEPAGKGSPAPAADGVVDVPPGAPSDLSSGAPTETPPDAPSDLPPGVPPATAVDGPSEAVLPASDPKTSQSAV
ncbi:hypothetical protein [Desulfovibrio sp. TomC]|uniref:hypothetical protein n=1 Tax=Desulfovibrio sp. TomC TaxID=1562888 RepID=UPI0005739C54|nr:hypothetical protein [Desulfovibrio sp. TomC]KHK03658.1 hypothetical protein NY78_0714 [Desulfovibrio sp. TomC]